LYRQIKFVEFLDFLCRVAIDYFEIVTNSPNSLEDKVFEIIRFFWPEPIKKNENKMTKNRKEKREKKEQKIPLL
jgi:hypothetical protein